jgi:hypothetical protein
MAAGLERLWAIGQLDAATMVRAAGGGYAAPALHRKSVYQRVSCGRVGRFTAIFGGGWPGQVWYEGLAGWLPILHIPVLQEKLAPGQAPAPLQPAAAAAAAAAAPAAAAQAAAAAAGESQYVQEHGFQTHTDAKGEKFVWDDSRQEWLPYEQAMYMLGFDGKVAQAPPPNPDEEEIDARIQKAKVRRMPSWSRSWSRSWSNLSLL